MIIKTLWIQPAIKIHKKYIQNRYIYSYQIKKIVEVMRLLSISFIIQKQTDIHRDTALWEQLLLVAFSWCPSLSFRFCRQREAT